MSAFFLEQPLRLGGILIVVWLGALIAWRLTQQDLWKRISLLGGVIGIALVVTNITVKTEREQLDAFLSGLFGSITQKGLPGVMDAISPDFLDDDIDYATLQRELKGRHAQWQFSRIERLKWSYQRTESNKVIMEFRCRPVMQLGGMPQPIEPSTWALHLKKSQQPKAWKITKIIPIALTLPMDAGSATQLKQLLRRR